MSKRSSILLAAGVALVVGVFGCGGSDKPTAPVVDTVAPVAVLDLSYTVITGVIGGQPVQSSIELVWADSPEPDLAAYRVYRAKDGGASTLVGVETAATFRDGTVIVGSTYEYFVTAVDQAGNESPRVSTGAILVQAGGKGGDTFVD